MNGKSAGMSVFAQSESPARAPSAAACGRRSIAKKTASVNKTGRINVSLFFKRIASERYKSIRKGCGFCRITMVVRRVKSEN